MLVDEWDDEGSCELTTSLEVMMEDSEEVSIIEGGTIEGNSSVQAVTKSKTIELMKKFLK
jgi:hypothetical protein